MSSTLDAIKQLKSINFNDISKDELESQLPLLGINDEMLEQFPKELYKHCTGLGLRFWQYPNQFSAYLKFLSQLEINSYLEIGCRWGGTFIIVSEALRQRNPNITLYACDIMRRSEILAEYSTIEKFNYLNKSSFTLRRKDFHGKRNNDHNFIMPSLPITENLIDLVFVDGGHQYASVEKDFNLARRLGAKYIAFHDISSSVCPGSTNHWNKLKEKYKNQYVFHEFVDQYDSVSENYLGIGVMAK